ncbi:MAG TPA: carbon-nitrogen hydrolase family protein [Gemmatimonadaceae bacterium]|nr:carbon-nitrogen hydrolase family protein [Gemmatimonadaceae bacterium]
MTARRVRLTISQTRDTATDFADDWDALVAHVRAERSALVLLPEMAFAPWFAASDRFDRRTWEAAVASHERWIARLAELAPAAVVSTRPIARHGRRCNEAFVWDTARGYRAAHVKYFLPREPGFHETAWYGPGDGSFTPVESADLSLGVLICTEMWSLGHAQRYGKAGAHLIAVPRATSRDSGEKWRTGGRAAAIVSGAYTASSARAASSDGQDLGGGGWVAAPDGELLAVTTDAAPFATVEIDPACADAAKATYPRYALE